MISSSFTNILSSQQALIINMDSQLRLYQCQGLKSNRTQCNTQIKSIHPQFAYCSHHRANAPRFDQITEQEVEILLMMRAQKLIEFAHHGLSQGLFQPQKQQPTHHQRQYQEISSNCVENLQLQLAGTNFFSYDDL